MNPFVFVDTVFLVILKPNTTVELSWVLNKLKNVND